MPEMEEPRVALARLRVSGVRVLSGGGRELSSLEASAERAGRRLVDATTPESPAAEVTLGWVEASEPVAGGDSGVTRTEMPDELVLTFASALRACWPDRGDAPFPGGWASVEAVLEARAIMGTLSGSDGNDRRSAEFHRKGALRRLREAGCLVGDDQRVRLGPFVATWSDGQVDVLRSVYDDLPVAPDLPGGVAFDGNGEGVYAAGDTEDGDIEQGELVHDVEAMDLDDIGTELDGSVPVLGIGCNTNLDAEDGAW